MFGGSEARSLREHRASSNFYLLGVLNMGQYLTKGSYKQARLSGTIA